LFFSSQARYAEAQEEVEETKAQLESLGGKEKADLESLQKKRKADLESLEKEQESDRELLEMNAKLWATKDEAEKKAGLRVLGTTAKFEASINAAGNAGLAVYFGAANLTSGGHHCSLYSLLYTPSLSPVLFFLLGLLRIRRG
jgi:hypothetical protein